MISEFNATLPSRQNRTKFNNGLFHEIQTAIFLVSKGEISHGNQISRGLTAKETAAGLNGNSQLITAPTTAGKSREIDMVCEQVVDGKTRTILVEAKDTQSPDTSQIPGNIALAQQIGALVGIALPASKARQKPSFTDAYNRNPAAQALGPLIFIDVPTDQAEQSFTKQYENGVVAGLASISTADSLSEVRPDTGEEQFAE